MATFLTILIIALGGFAMSVRTAQQYREGALVRLGRVTDVRQPGSRAPKEAPCAH